MPCRPLFSAVLSGSSPSAQCIEVSNDFLPQGEGCHKTCPKHIDIFSNATLNKLRCFLLTLTPARSCIHREDAAMATPTWATGSIPLALLMRLLSTVCGLRLELRWRPNLPSSKSWRNTFLGEILESKFDPIISNHHIFTLAELALILMD